jgi:copper homeostasis protein
LCAALDLGGLTPSLGMMEAAANCGLPVHAMIRPRAGGFVYSAAEIAIMCRDIAAARTAGLAGVVLGASRKDGRLDPAALGDLAAAADGLELTLHRVFDLAPEPAEAVEVAISVGMQRILTSGRAATAVAGAAALGEIFALCRGRIAVMPGGGISAATIGALRHLPLTDVHASCSMPAPAAETEIAFGFASRQWRQTDADAVRALKIALAD